MAANWSEGGPDPRVGIQPGEHREGRLVECRRRTNRKEQENTFKIAQVGHEAKQEVVGSWGGLSPQQLVPSRLWVAPALPKCSVL